MDTRAWKNILLSWIGECDFFDRQSFNIEQTDIDAFFHIYMQYMNEPEDSENNKPDTHLAAFLKENYPDFEPHFDDEGCLSATDYVYVYSLLLHYCCVKRPKAHFHDICQRLPEQPQRSIAKFFQKLLEGTQFTKETLRHIIGEVVQLSPPRVPLLNLSSSLNDRSGQARFESPSKCLNSSRISPVTPKTSLLEDRTRELSKLRSKLETERYEKGVLELQVIQSEKMMQKYREEESKLRQTVQQLKNEILTMSSEGDPIRSNDDEQLKKRWSKEITLKGQEIIRLTDLTTTLEEQNNMEKEKLRHANQEIKTLLDRINEQETQLIDLQSEIEEKTQKNSNLEKQVDELTNFIKEARLHTNGHNKTDLNSSDCETSYYDAANSSSLQTSPENMANAVVDKQLREKEYENRMLREQLGHLRRSDSLLASSMEKLVQDCLKEPCQLPDGTAAKNNDACDSQTNMELAAAEQFNMLVKGVQQICQMYQDQRQSGMLLKQTYETETQSLQQRIQQFEEELKEMKAHMQQQVETIEELTQAEQALQQELQQSKQDIQRVNAEKLQLVDQLKDATQEYIKHKDNCKLQLQQVNERLLKMEQELDRQIKLNEDKTDSVRDLTQQNAALLDKVNALKLKLKDKTDAYHAQLQALSEQLDQKCEQLKEHQEAEFKVKTINEQLRISLEDCQQKIREQDKYNNKQQDIIEQLHQAGQELKQRNSALESTVTAIKGEKAQLQNMLTRLRNDSETTHLSYKKCQKELMNMQAHAQTLAGLLKTPPDADNGNNLGDIVEIVRELLEQNAELQHNVDHLTTANVKYEKKFARHEKDMHKIMQERDMMEKSYELENMACAKQLEESHERIKQYEVELQTLRQVQSAFIDKLEIQLQGTRLNSQSISHKLEQVNAEQQQVLHSIVKSRMAEQADFERIEHELILLIGEHNALKEKLLSTDAQLQKYAENERQLIESYNEKLAEMQNKNAQHEAENLQIGQQMSQYQADLELKSQRMDEAVNKLNVVSQSLQAERNFNEQLTQKCLQTESQLQISRNEYMAMQQEVQTYFNHVKEMMAKVEILQPISEAYERQTQKLVEMEQQMQQQSEENRLMVQEAAEKALEIEQENAEKQQLLLSLHDKIEHLKSAVSDEQKQMELLRKNHDLLQVNHDAQLAKCEQLQTQILAKQQELAQQKQQYEAKHAALEHRISTLVQQEREHTSMLQASDEILADMQRMLRTHSGEAELQQNGLENVAAKCQNIKMQLQPLIQSLQDHELKLKQTMEKQRLTELSVATLANEKQDLNVKLQNLLKQQNLEAQKQENKLLNEIQQLTSDFKNLEAVNDKALNEKTLLELKLSEAETTIEKLNSEKQELERVYQEVTYEKRSLGEAIEFYMIHKTELEAQVAAFQESEAIGREREKQKKEEIAKLNNEIEKLQVSLATTEQDIPKLMDHTAKLQSNIQALQTELECKNKEICVLQNQCADFSTEQQTLHNQLTLATTQHNETLAAQASLTAQCAELRHQVLELQKEQEALQAQLHAKNEELKLKLNETLALKQKKATLAAELHEKNLELKQEKDNVKLLIGQVSVLTGEKSHANEGNTELKKQMKQMQELLAAQSSSEQKFKEQVSRLDEMKKALASKDNEIQQLEQNLQQSQLKCAKVEQQHAALLAAQKEAEKRINLQACNLGEVQATCASLKRENEKYCAQIRQLEQLQRDKDLLNSECNALKERLNKADQTARQNVTHIKKLESELTFSKEAKLELEGIEKESKSKIEKLEKARHQSEENLMKIKQQLIDSERTCREQNLLVGELNAKLQQKVQEHKAQIECTAQTEQKYKESQEQVKKLQTEVDGLKAHTAELLKQATTANEAMLQTKAECEQLKHNNADLKQRLLLLQHQKQQQQDKLEQYAEQASLMAELNKRLEQLEKELLDKNAEIEQLNCTLKTLQQRCETTEAEDSELQEELRAVRAEILIKEDLLEKERALVLQLRLDNQALQSDCAKFTEQAKKAEEEKQECLRENRLVMEGKLEKMKAKMPSTWKRFAKSCAKNSIVFLLLQAAFILVISYFMHLNDLELEIKSNSPVVF